MARRPSPVAIMSGQKRSPTSIAKDDPMDLGPFLNEYVLNNPFTPTASPLPPRPVVSVKSERVLAPSPTRMSCAPRSGINSPTVTTTMSQIPVLAVKAIPSPIVHQVAPIVHSQGPQVVHSMALRSPGNVVGPLMTLGGPLAIVDTPKAHIGSNHTFAIMLRESKLPHKHIKVKKWLLDNYRHIPTSAVWLSSDDLLDHAHEFFTDLKGNVMSRIMKVTFPQCHKVTNKYGYFYMGLISRPRKEHYGDELLRMAAEAITTGQMTLHMAAEVHGVSSDLLNRMVVWFDTLNDPVPEVKPMVTGTDSESEEVDVEANSPSPCNNLKRKLRQKARCRLLTKMNRSGERDSSPDWQPRSATRPRPYATRRSSARLRSSGEKGGVAEVHVKAELGSDSDGDDDTRMDCEDVSSEASLPLATPALPVMTAIGSVHIVDVKSEPADTGYNAVGSAHIVDAKSEPAEASYNCYEQCKDSSPIANSPEWDAPDNLMESFRTLRHILNEKPGSSPSKTNLRNITDAQRSDPHPIVDASKSGPTSKQDARPERTTPPASTSSATVNGGGGGGGAGKSSQSLSSVVDLLTVKQALQQARDDLNDQQNQNSDLERKLDSAHSEIEQLQKTVSSQETQLFDLASEFFELSNRFMKMTHKFKQALTDAKSMRT